VYCSIVILPRVINTGIVNMFFPAWAAVLPPPLLKEKALSCRYQGEAERGEFASSPATVGAFHRGARRSFRRRSSTSDCVPMDEPCWREREGLGGRLYQL